MSARTYKAWTEPEYRRAVAMLRDGTTHREIARRLCRTTNSIQGVAAKARTNGDVGVRFGQVGDEEMRPRWEMMARICEDLALERGVSIDDVVSPKDGKGGLRHEAMFLMVSAKNEAGEPALPYQTIAAFFDLDHSTVFGGARKHAQRRGLSVERRSLGRKRVKRDVDGTPAPPSIDPQIMVESLADGRGATTPRPPLHQRPSEEVRQCREAI